jgi:hypothetical protein
MTIPISSSNAKAIEATPHDSQAPAHPVKGALIGLALGAATTPLDRWNHVRSVDKPFLPALQGSLINQLKQIGGACVKGTGGRSFYVGTSLATIEATEHALQKLSGTELTNADKLAVIAAETVTTLPVFTYYRLRMEGMDRKTILRTLPQHFKAAGVAAYAAANVAALTLPMFIAPRMEKALREQANVSKTAAGITSVSVNSGLTAVVLNMRNVAVNGNPKKGLTPAVLRDISYGLALREVSSSEKKL